MIARGEAGSRGGRAFFGWKVVVVAFFTALFSWGLGFYGTGIYLVELRAQHGWSIALISSAITAYYVLSAGLITFVGDAFERFGPRRVVLGGAVALGGGVLSLAWLSHPWQLYVSFAVMAVGWAATSGAAVNAIVAPWFEKKRGLAISLALNGASAGGVFMAPLWIALIDVVGFTRAGLVVVGGLMAVLAPLAVLYLYRGPAEIGLYPDGTASSDMPERPAGTGAQPLPRAELIRSIRFWTIAGSFGLGLIAQVGFLTHQVAYLSPLLGAAGAALAVTVTTVAAITGRVGTGLFIDRVDRRLAAGVNFAMQAAALAILMRAESPMQLYLGCALFGLGVGNAITFPSLIVHTEYSAGDFNRVVSLIVAINQITFAFGPAILGWTRDRWGSYAVALGICLVADTLAAIIVLAGMPRLFAAARERSPSPR
jgi:MFS family permease